MLKTRDALQEQNLTLAWLRMPRFKPCFYDLLTVIICAMGRGTQEPLYLETIKNTIGRARTTRSIGLQS
jgi:hypothetical protein